VEEFSGDMGVATRKPRVVEQRIAERDLALIWAGGRGMCVIGSGSARG
jgi:hypothetical protein